MTIRRSSPYLVLAAAVALAVGGCADGRTDRSAGPPAPTSSGAPSPGAAEAQVPPATSAPAAPAPTTRAPRSGTGGGDAPAAPTSVGPAQPAARPTTDSDPACRPQALQEATAAAMSGQTVGGVEVLACRNGFARLVATAAGSTEISGGNQVFLRLENRLWRVVGRTPAASDCGDPGLTAEVKAVCAGLG
ncbi:hypothetical protein GA0074695_1720 [Micromonospora viridifaciens]|uniref:Uncharacterized protein n=1 Tax=Micromonospora viridifaciens TaxID=1881 RepID=A0A1C4VRI2_MICVI|nr:hypothetical protein [Micromonospora viridifaciens]SCE86624.1 hypothetical protein GA0074695_1720 [Micromonospora viridifaciens]